MNDAAAVKLQWGVKIPLRDGIQLNGTLYSPRCQVTPVPCILTVTPYISDALHARARYFAEQGFPFIVVDSRGRGNSEGNFNPYLQEAPDGYDIVEWLAAQPYCNGKVAMCGGSYNGYNQWATAKELPPHLATIVPAAAAHLGTDFPMRNNIFYPFIIQWLLFTAGRASQITIFSDRQFWSELYYEWHRSGRSFKALGRCFGSPSGLLEEWLNHPEQGEYWDAYNPAPDQLAQMRIPILTITGAYDDDQSGALEHYARHLRFTREAVSECHFLIIGPWDHAGTRTPSREFGGLRFGPESIVDLQQLHVEWYRWTMLCGPRPTFLKDRVAYYVMGEDRWRYARTLEAATSHHEVLFLDSTQNATSLFLSGTLDASVGTGEPDTYTYDPRCADTPGAAAEFRTDGGLLTDQSVALAQHGQLLVYHSPPFDKDREITGFFKLFAWIAIDCPDSDFYVSIHEVCSDGSSIRLSTDAVRARYRDGLHTPKLLTTTAPLLYGFERFTWISRVVKRGHRLRLIIAPTGRIVESTFWQKNYNSGGAVSEESSETGRAVTVRLYHEERYPSALHLPVGCPDPPGDTV